MITAALFAESKADAKDKVETAAALVILVSSYEFILALTIFREILTMLNLVSLYFQKNHVNYGDMRDIPVCVREGFNTCYLGDSFVGGDCYAELEAAKDGCEPGDSFDYNKLADIVYDTEAEIWVQNGTVEFVKSVVEGLKQRFPYNDLMAALGNFDFIRFPASRDAWDKGKTDYDKAEIDTLVDWFGKARSGTQRTFAQVVDPLATKAEWSVFKALLFKFRLEGASLDAGYAELIESDTMPNVKTLACYFLVLCLSTVWCERGFSLMLLIKNRLRNGLQTETLVAFMMISSNGPEMHETAKIL